MTNAPLLSQRLDRALAVGGDSLDHLASATPRDRRDALLALMAIHDLHLAPIERLAGRERWQHHPAVSALKNRLESGLIEQLEDEDAAAGWDLPDDAPAAMRAVARAGLVPPVYEWLATEAGGQEVVDFLALEGGPDGGFDDLVAACQIGLAGEAKVEMATNFWDEMGNGDLRRVHTRLHEQLVEAIAMPDVPRHEQPTEALERTVLGGVLATNRWLQPELVGALGLLELQAGPRCRKVVAALERLDAPEGALPFYVEHATVDPRHGKDWLDHAIAPLAAEHPEWGPRMVRGARWRSLMNARFFDAMAQRFCPAPAARAS